MTARDLAYRVGQASGDPALALEVLRLIVAAEQSIIILREGAKLTGDNSLCGVANKLATALGEQP